MSTHQQPLSATLTGKQREADVLGNGPRIAPLAIDELTDDLLKIITRMAAVNTAIQARERSTLTVLLGDEATQASEEQMAERLARIPEIVRTMLRHPDLFARHADIGIQLLAQGTLPARDREMAVLRIAWLCGAPYEWGEHVAVARMVGLNSEEIERITQGSGAAGWNEHECALLRACEELRSNAMISDATWNTLAIRYNAQQLIELPMLIGQYQAVAYYQNSLRLRLHPGNQGLQAR